MKLPLIVSSEQKFPLVSRVAKGLYFLTISLSVHRLCLWLAILPITKHLYNDGCCVDYCSPLASILLYQSVTLHQTKTHSTLRAPASPVLSHQPPEIRPCESA